MFYSEAPSTKHLAYMALRIQHSFLFYGEVNRQRWGHLPMGMSYLPLFQVPNTPQALFHSVLTISCRQDCLLSTLHKRGNWGTKRWGHLPEVTEKVPGRVGHRPLVCPTPETNPCKGEGRKIFLPVYHLKTHFPTLTKHSPLQQMRERATKTPPCLNAAIYLELNFN